MLDKIEQLKDEIECLEEKLQDSESRNRKLRDKLSKRNMTIEELTGELEFVRSKNNMIINSFRNIMNEIN